MKRLFSIFLLITVAAVPLGLGFAVWGYFYITRDLPTLTSIKDYRPAAVSKVLARDGTVVAEFFREQRYPISIDSVPLHVRHAFLAAEDAGFYSHPGIDLLGIGRALIRNIQAGSVRQGGSTITQQVVKNLLLRPERSITRKAKEAILAYQLERSLSKDDIFTIYLNEIFLGNFSYGIAAAAKNYFRKEVADLTLAEAAILAGLPQAPSRFSPLLNPTAAKNRQRYVLEQMVRAGFVSEADADAARRERLTFQRASLATIKAAPYYVAEVRRVFAEHPKLRGLDIDADGLTVETSLDLEADRAATLALRIGLREVDKRRGWRGPLASLGNDGDARYGEFVVSDPEEGLPVPALVTQIRPEAILLRVGTVEGELQRSSLSWARRRLSAEQRVTSEPVEKALRRGDIVEVMPVQRSSAPEGSLPQFALDQTPEIEGAVTILDPHTGRVVAVVGGVSFRRSKFNRATQGLRQPGSTFKPVVYLAAVDGFGYTPVSIVQDVHREFRVGDEVWSPENFDESFLGPITLQTALEKSRNLVSADIVSKIGIQAVVQYARRLGIESRLGQNLSLSLGSSEVTLLELTRAYGVFPARGILNESVLIDRVLDRNGVVIYDSNEEQLTRSRRAISEQSAFLLTHMMRGVVERGTGSRIRDLNRPSGGKTGTSNDHMDTWYIGFTPQWTAGVWVGFDVKRNIGKDETGGRLAAPIWLDVMKSFLSVDEERQYQRLVTEAEEEASRLGIAPVVPEKIPLLEFSVPDGVYPAFVDRDSGVQVEPTTPGAILEYFAQGTGPNPPSDTLGIADELLSSPEL